MAENQEKKLEQTKSQFKLRGIVNRLDNAEIKTGETGSGKAYKSLRFSVKTNENEEETNEIFVELFGMVKDKVIAYSQDEKKTLKLDFDERDNVPDGYELIGTRINWDGNAKVLAEYDAVDEIKESLSDGESVYIGGDLNFNLYTPADGDPVVQTQYQIKSISKLKNEIDFSNDKFKPMNSFEKEIVYVDSEVLKKQNELHIVGRQISYNEDFVDGIFVIDLEKNKKFAANIHKKLKFGDVIKLKGYCWNRALISQVENNNAEEDEFGGEDPTGFNGVTNYERKLEVTNADTKSWIKGKYREDDFVKLVDDGSSEFKESNDDSFGEELGEDDPFS